MAMDVGSSSLGMLSQALKIGGGAAARVSKGLHADESDDKKKDGYSLFDSVDADGDGLVTATEFSSFPQRLATQMSAALLDVQAQSGETGTDAFASLDANGDGSLDSTEFAAGFAPPPPPDGGDTAQTDVDGFAADLFAGLDANDDGMIDGDELQSALSAALGADDTQSDATGAAALFAQLDTNQDGAIGKDELAAALAANRPDVPVPPQQTAATQTDDAETTTTAAAPADGSGGTQSSDPLDTNRDGIVSTAERLAALQSSGLVSQQAASLATGQPIPALGGPLASNTLASLIQAAARA